MKKNIGSVLGMYPTPVVIVGVEEENGKKNWINIAHVGILGIDRIILTMHKSHYTNEIIKKNKVMSINVANEEMITASDYVGMVSGAKVDKSDVFKSFKGKMERAPMIVESPVSMECRLVDNYETNTHDNFIVEIKDTYVNEDVLSENGTIDYEKVKPIMFEMPNRQYMTIGKVIGKCWNIGSNYKK